MPDRVQRDGVGLREQIDPRTEGLESLRRHRRANALSGVDKPAKPAEDVNEGLGRGQRLSRRSGAKNDVVQVVDYAEAARARGQRVGLPWRKQPKGLT